MNSSSLSNLQYSTGWTKEGLHYNTTCAVKEARDLHCVATSLNIGIILCKNHVPSYFTLSLLKVVVPCLLPAWLMVRCLVSSYKYCAVLLLNPGSPFHRPRKTEAAATSETKQGIGLLAGCCDKLSGLSSLDSHAV